MRKMILTVLTTLAAVALSTLTVIADSGNINP